MVFMQYKTFPDGRREPLQVQVIDVGIGLERVPWLINGSPTSYMDVFPTPLKYLLTTLGLDIDAQIWEKFGPLSCLLNVDELDDVEKTWEKVSKEIGVEASRVKKAIEPIRDCYVVLDHTRSILMAIEDGSLPSNVGGGQNIRNILRRVFALLKRNGWWAKLKMPGFLKIFELHKQDLATLYGQFKEYPSFGPIIELEYDRWVRSDQEQKKELERELAKITKSGKPFELKDWIRCMQSYGVPPETIAQVVKQEIPGNLWTTIAEIQESQQANQNEAVLYNTAHLPVTESTYYSNHKDYEFKAKIVEVLPNAKSMIPDIVVLDRSAFYPTSGGQEHDTGSLTINGTTYAVVNVEKVGPAVLHFLEKPLPVKKDLSEYKGVVVSGKVDEERREQLRNNHTATHIVFAACRRVLGPHVWQAGAQKKTHKAHLDITHFQSIPHEDLVAIENEANRIVHRSKAITKGFMPKDVAERQYGFSLYQGGVVPGNELRVVNISETDTEACCGTHCDNTAEVGHIKVIRSGRISDGIVRLEYVAGDHALGLLNEESNLLHDLTAEWGVEKKDILPTATRFFEGYKDYLKIQKSHGLKLLKLQLKSHLLDPKDKLLVDRSEESNPSLYIGNMGAYAAELKATKKSAVYVGEDFVFGVFGDASAVDQKELQAVLEKESTKKKANKEQKLKQAADTADKADSKSGDKGDSKAAAPAAVKKAKVKFDTSISKPSKVDGILQVNATSVADTDAVVEYLLSKGFKLPE